MENRANEKVSYSKMGYIESLIQTALITNDEAGELLRRLPYILEWEADEWIEELTEKQPDNNWFAPHKNQ